MAMIDIVEHSHRSPFLLLSSLDPGPLLLRALLLSYISIYSAHVERMYTYVGRFGIFWPAAFRFSLLSTALPLPFAEVEELLGPGAVDAVGSSLDRRL